MWYQFLQPARAANAVLAMWRTWLLAWIGVLVMLVTTYGIQLHEVGTPRFRQSLQLDRWSWSPELCIVYSVLVVVIVFLWEGLSRGLPYHLRVFGDFDDSNPWMYNKDASDFAEALVTTPGEIDAGTGVEIMRVTGNIIEPGQPGTLFFRRPIRRTWDNLWDIVRNRPCKRGVIVGNARTGKSYSLLYVLRKALRDGRVVVLELRKQAKAVYLFEPSGKGRSFRCRAWPLGRSHDVHLVSHRRPQHGRTFCPDHERPAGALR